MKQTAIIIAASLVLSGCAGVQSGINLVANSLNTPTTAVECLQRAIDKQNVGVTYDVVAGTYDLVTAAGWVATAGAAFPITFPLEMIAGKQVGQTAKVIVEQISDQKDLACKEIAEAQ